MAQLPIAFSTPCSCVCGMGWDGMEEGRPRPSMDGFCPRGIVILPEKNRTATAVSIVKTATATR